MSNNVSPKEWTVLLYAAGRNELEPEIFASFRALITAGLPADKIGLAIQIARPPGHFLALLRPMTDSRSESRWTGVRRYKAGRDETTLIADLGDANMANPETLADYLCWGMESMPARRLMVIISGHGAGFLGLITDYDPARRSLMSIKGFTQALSSSILRSGRKIDVLVMDACHMQMVEIWYELAQLQHPVDYLVTPLGQLRLGGMNLPALLSGLSSFETKGISPALLLARIIGKINSAEGAGGELMLVRPDRRMLCGLKKIFGYSCQQAAGDFPLNHGGTLSVIDYFANLPLPFRREATRIMAGLCLFPPATEIKKGRNLGPSVLSPVSPDYHGYQSYYDSLLFAQQNPWTQYVANTAFPAPLTVPLSSTIAAMLSQNPGMTKVQALDNAARMGWLKPDYIGLDSCLPPQPSRSIIL